MSSFNCEKCGASCLDSKYGYTHGCKHYPRDESAVNHFVSVYMGTHVSELVKKDEQFNMDWSIGQGIYLEMVRINTDDRLRDL